MARRVYCCALQQRVPRPVSARSCYHMARHVSRQDDSVCELLVETEHPKISNNAPECCITQRSRALLVYSGVFSVQLSWNHPLFTGSSVR